MALLTIAEFASTNSALLSQGKLLSLDKGTQTGGSLQVFCLVHPENTARILLDSPPEWANLPDAIDRLTILDRSLKELPDRWTWTKWRQVANRDSVRLLSIPDLYVYAGLTPTPDPQPTPTRQPHARQAASRIHRGLRLRQIPRK
jgi:hypothetical protein